MTPLALAVRPTNQKKAPQRTLDLLVVRSDILEQNWNSGAEGDSGSRRRPGGIQMPAIIEA